MPAPLPRQALFGLLESRHPAGQDVEAVRPIRDEISALVEGLIAEEPRSGVQGTVALESAAPRPGTGWRPYCVASQSWQRLTAARSVLPWVARRGLEGARRRHAPGDGAGTQPYRGGRMSDGSMCVHPGRWALPLAWMMIAAADQLPHSPAGVLLRGARGAQSAQLCISWRSQYCMSSLCQAARTLTGTIESAPPPVRETPPGRVHPRDSSCAPSVAGRATKASPKRQYRL